MTEQDNPNLQRQLPDDQQTLDAQETLKRKRGQDQDVEPEPEPEEAGADA